MASVEDAKHSKKEKKNSKKPAENGVDELPVVWDADQELTLLSKVREHLDQAEPAYKRKNKTVYVKDIVWNEVEFEGFDADACKTQWKAITSRIRKMRSAREILLEAKGEVQQREKKHDQKMKSEKRKREKDDPSVPKKPKSSFFLFIEKKRPRFITKYPDLGYKEMSVKLGKKWNKLSEEKKQTYRDIYNEGMVEYEEKLISYLLEHNPDELPPKTAFDLWAEVKEAEVREGRPEISHKKVKKKLTNRWERLEAIEKELWERKANDMRKKMIKRLKVG